ncbi:MAG: hypothetical protein KJO78_16490 [Alphaproteobacteria bacterium]|nr:hypothetical protein [Alphaproteobacteria bacterium]
MTFNGHYVYAAGVALAAFSGVLISWDPGTVCRLSSDAMPDSPFSYPALCFTFWAYSVPVGLILAATGALMLAGAGRGLTLPFLIGALATYAAIAIANDPMPHIPPLFGIGGGLILLFYFLILWVTKAEMRANPFKLIGYTFLVTGFWFACGMASRPYHDLLDSGQSPIDIMAYFVIAMGFLLLGEVRARRWAPDAHRTGLEGHTA